MNIHQQLLQEVKNYKMPSSAAKFLSQNPPLIISSVTASGKNTIANYILNHGRYYEETVSHTTRPPRRDEINGTHYWFVDDNEMLRLVQNRDFVEVKVIHGETIYGTSIKSYKSVTSRGRQPLLIIDVQGVEEISDAIGTLKPFFLLPPSYEEWMNRLHSRGVVTLKDKTQRMVSARRELQTVLKNPAYLLVVNDNVGRTAGEILLGKINTAKQIKNRQLAQKLLEHLMSSI